MAITEEVEVSSEEVKKELTKWTKREDAYEFPFKEGEFCLLTEDLAEAMGTDPNAPVLVINAAKGSNMAIIALVNKNGRISALPVSARQLRSENEPEEGEKE